MVFKCLQVPFLNTLRKASWWSQHSKYQQHPKKPTRALEISKPTYTKKCLGFLWIHHNFAKRWIDRKLRIRACPWQTRRATTRNWKQIWACLGIGYPQILWFSLCSTWFNRHVGAPYTIFIHFHPFSTSCIPGFLREVASCWSFFHHGAFYGCDVQHQLRRSHKHQLPVFSPAIRWLIISPTSPTIKAPDVKSRPWQCSWWPDLSRILHFAGGLTMFNQPKHIQALVSCAAKLLSIARRAEN